MWAKEEVNLLIRSTRPIFTILADVGDRNEAQQVQKEPRFDVCPRDGPSIGKVAALRVNWHVETNDYIDGEEKIQEDVIVDIFPRLFIGHENQLEGNNERHEDLVDQDDRCVYQIDSAKGWKETR